MTHEEIELLLSRTDKEDRAAEQWTRMAENTKTDERIDERDRAMAVAYFEKLAEECRQAEALFRRLALRAPVDVQWACDHGVGSKPCPTCAPQSHAVLASRDVQPETEPAPSRDFVSYPCGCREWVDGERCPTHVGSDDAPFALVLSVPPSAAPPADPCEDCQKPATTTREGLMREFHLCDECAAAWDRLDAKEAAAAPLRREPDDDRLRMARTLEDIAIDYFRCVCTSDYTNRNLTDPDCDAHDGVAEDLNRAAKLLRAPVEEGDDRPLAYGMAAVKEGEVVAITLDDWGTIATAESVAKRYGGESVRVEIRRTPTPEEDAV